MTKRPTRRKLLPDPGLTLEEGEITLGCIAAASKSLGLFVPRATEAAIKRARRKIERALKQGER